MCIRDRLYAKRAKELEVIVAERYAVKDVWAKAHPDLAAKMEQWFSGKAPQIDWAAIEQKANQASYFMEMCIRDSYYMYVAV